MTPKKTSSELDELADAVLTASRVLVAVAARSLSQLGEDVSLPQFRSLVVLATQGAQRPVDLAGALGVDPSTVTRLCDRLARKGLITRRRSPTDRREVHVALSARGAALVSTVTDLRRQEIRRILQGVPPGTHRELVRAFRAFSAAAGEEPALQQVWEL